MEAFALRKVQELVDAVVLAMNNALPLNDPEAIHAMRVSIRRLQQALRIFKQYLNAGGVRRVRKQLKKAMTAAGTLRNHDIALELLAKVSKEPAELHTGRAAAASSLRETLESLVNKDTALKWRVQLGLPS